MREPDMLGWASPFLPKVIHSVGNYDGGDGMELVLKGPIITFQAIAEGVEIRCDMSVIDLLLAIQGYDKDHES